MAMTENIRPNDWQQRFWIEQNRRERAEERLKRIMAWADQIAADPDDAWVKESLAIFMTNSGPV